jgi:ABC-type multidrug transport system ATPase subunit
VSVVSSHVVQGLEEIATNVVVVAGGRVAYAGPCAELAGAHGSMERAYLALQKV